MSRLQFSLRALLAIPVLVGILALVMTTGREWLAVAIVQMALLVQFSVVLVAVAIGGVPRTFGLGALFPAAVGATLVVKPLFHLPQSIPKNGIDAMILRNLHEGWPADIVDLRFRLGSLLFAALICGLAGMATAWVCAPTRPRQEK